MAARKPRIEIPKNPDDLIKLLEKVTTKHEKDAANSPLKDLEMSPFKSLTAEAKKQHSDGEDFRKKAESCTQARDLALGTGRKAVEKGTALFILLKIRDTLMGRYKGEEQKLGDWGFAVDASPKAKGAKGGAEKAK